MQQMVVKVIRAYGKGQATMMEVEDALLTFQSEAITDYLERHGLKYLVKRGR